LQQGFQLLVWQVPVSELDLCFHL